MLAASTLHAPRRARYFALSTHDDKNRTRNTNANAIERQQNSTINHANKNENAEILGNNEEKKKMKQDNQKQQEDVERMMNEEEYVQQQKQKQHETIDNDTPLGGFEDEEETISTKDNTFSSSSSSSRHMVEIIIDHDRVEGTSGTPISVASSSEKEECLEETEGVVLTDMTPLSLSPLSSAPPRASKVLGLLLFMREAVSSFLTHQPAIDQIYNVVIFAFVVVGAFLVRASLVTFTSLAVSLAMLGVTIAKARADKSNKEARSGILHLFQLLFITIGLPFFFFSIAQNGETVMNDASFVAADSLLLPFLPNGQLSLWIDNNSIINPGTVFGKLLTDFFCLIYLTYYVWTNAIPYFFAMYCGYLLYLRHKKHTHVDEERYQAAWRTLRHISVMCASTYLTVLLINLSLPGKSPRLFLKSEFKHELTGFGLTGLARKVIEQDGTSATFPSGHVAETCSMTIASFWFAPERLAIWLRPFSALSCSLMFLSTLWLRFHYFVDAFSGLCVSAVAFGLSYSGRLRKSSNTSSLLSVAVAVETEEEEEKKGQLQEQETNEEGALTLPAKRPSNESLMQNSD
eukprot:TRINITY_DN741_c0_g1_i1.p1 TRINITY_DN741_c0_g1~~TRINITY_DN741_c0_g1_i1.p1  ORF type:complete len:575 (+),score=212.65 TRINITY_DN741_c0_g1_i1:55-1779(+)